MPKAIVITQYGVARITKDSKIDAIYTEGLKTCLGIALVNDNNIQMVHCDTNVDVAKVAATFKNFPGPYALIIAYNHGMHIGFSLLGNDSPYSKENFLSRLKAALIAAGLPLWETNTFVPTNTQNFGVSFSKKPFFAMKETDLMRAENTDVRININMLRYFTSLPDKPVAQNMPIYSQTELDLQYTDAGWQPMPTINYLTQKLCWFFDSVKYDLTKLRTYLNTDKEMAACAKIITMSVPSDEHLGQQLRSIIDFYNAQQKQKAALTPHWTNQTQKNDIPPLFLHTIQAKAIRWDEATSSNILKGMSTSDISACNVIVIVGGKPGSFRVSMVHADRRVVAKNINDEAIWVGIDPKIFVFRNSLAASKLWMQRNENTLAVRPIVASITDGATAVSLKFSHLGNKPLTKDLLSVHMSRADIPFSFLRHPNELKSRTTGQINWFAEAEFSNTPLDFILFDGAVWSDLKPVELKLIQKSLDLVNKIGKKGHNETFKSLAQQLPPPTANMDKLAEFINFVTAVTPYIQQYIFNYQFSDIILFNMSQLNPELSYEVKTSRDVKIQRLLDKKISNSTEVAAFIKKEVLPLCTEHSDYQDMIRPALTLFLSFIDHAELYEDYSRYAQDVDDKINHLAASGSTCFKQKEYDKALPLFKEAFAYAQLIYTGNGVGTAHHNLGATYHELYLANSTEKDFLEKAQTHLNQAYVIRTKNKETELAQKSMKRLAEVNATLESSNKIKLNAF